MSSYHPLARTEGVLSQQTFEDLVLVDQRSNTAHSLNRTAALIYQNADGTRSIDDLVEVLRLHIGESADADLVEMTIEELSAADLLVTRPAPAVERPAMPSAVDSRRRFLQKVAMMGTLAALVPAVESIAAPSPDDSRSPTSKWDDNKKDDHKWWDDKKKDDKKKDDRNWWDRNKKKKNNNRKRNKNRRRW